MVTDVTDVTDVTELMSDIRSADRGAQGRAFEAMMAMTEAPVDWSYDVWDELVADLTHADNRVRAIAAQVLCKLAKSDPDERSLVALPLLVELTHDERFVTARHCLQSLSGIGVAGPRQREAYRQALTSRFAVAAEEKNGTLVRSDIIESLGRVHSVTGDEALVATAEQLIASEDDERYRRKYARVWRTAAAR